MKQAVLDCLILLCGCLEKRMDRLFDWITDRMVAIIDAQRYHAVELEKKTWLIKLLKAVRHS